MAGSRLLTKFITDFLLRLYIIIRSLKCDTKYTQPLCSPPNTSKKQQQPHSFKTIFQVHPIYRVREILLNTGIDRHSLLYYVYTAQKRA